MTEASAPAGKPRWERWLAVATVLVPASIALAGHLIGKEIKNTEIAAQDHREALNRELARSQLRISQAGVINTLMHALTSANPQERRLAVRAVLVALPEDGPALVRIVAEGDENQAVKAEAKATLSNQVNDLLQALYGPEKSARIQAAQALVGAWRADPAAAGAILAYADAHPDNEQGIFNTVIVLTDFTDQALLPHHQAIQRFADKARANGPKTDARLTALLAKIGPRTPAGTSAN